MSIIREAWLWGSDLAIIICATVGFLRIWDLTAAFLRRRHDERVRLDRERRRYYR